MKQILLLSLLSAFSFTVSAQTQGIEISVLGRYDKQADYSSRFANRSFTDDTKLWGRSYGVQLGLWKHIAEGFKLSVGAGYYRLNVDKIRSKASNWWQTAAARPIEYPDPYGREILFHTDRYHYDNVSISIGASYDFRLSSKVILSAGTDYILLHTISQSYHISKDNVIYQTADKRKLGFAVNAYLGILKKFNKNRFYINPKIIVPVYQKLEADKVFREDHNVRIEKWMSGGGLSISVGKYL